MDKPTQEEIRIYHRALANADVDTCVRIEKRYGLFGLPPQLVTEGLMDLADGKEEARNR